MEKIEQEEFSYLVSVVVVSYNCADVIEENLKSFFNETGNELIIVDNASKDGTVEIVKSYLCENIKLIENSVNKGFTFGCNQGIRASRGKYLMLLNPDAFLQIGTISLLVKYLNLNQNVGIVAPCLYFSDGKFQNYTRTFPTVGGLWVESFIPMRYWNYFLSYRKYTCQDINFNNIQKVEQPAGAALMFHNKWELDESYFIYGSDVDLCKRIKDSGHEIVQIPEAKIIHHQGKGGTENITLKLYLDLDNYYGMSYYFKKFNQPMSLFYYRLIFSISLFARALFSFLEDKDSLKNRWKKFFLFIRNKNFLSIYEN